MPVIVRGAPWQNFARVMEARLATVQAAAIAAFEASDPVGYTEYEVTSLSDANVEGTLRYALTSVAGNLRIVFTVGGTITLTSSFTAAKTGIKIVCGETAPSPGITIRGTYRMRFTAPVTIRHVRRIVDEGSGDPYGNRDAFEWLPTDASEHDADLENCGAENCSVYHGTDETVSFFPNVDFPALELHDVFVKNNIIAEAVWNESLYSGSPHWFGLLIGSPNEPGVPVKAALVQGNLLHSNRERNPRIGAGAEAWVLNNLVTNPGRYWFDCGNDGTSRPTKVSYVGNVVRNGPHDETFRTPFDQAGLPASSEVYWSDNYVDGVLTSLDDADIEGDLTFDPSVGSPPVAYPSGVSPVSAAKTPWTVLTTAGSCPWFYNAKDARMIYEACTGGGRTANESNEVFWPTGTDE